MKNKVYDLWRCPLCKHQEMVYIHSDMVLPPRCGECYTIGVETDMEEVK